MSVDGELARAASKIEEERAGKAEGIERPRLKKTIGGFGFFSLAFGSMIGVGWVTAMGGWFSEAGPLGAIVAFMTGGGLMLFIGLCYAELTPMMPVAGGEVAFAYRSSGTGAAFLVGGFLAFGYLAVCVFEAISIGTVLSYMLPGIVDVRPLYDVAGVTVHAGDLVVAFVFTAALTVINYVGVRWSAGLQSLLIAIFLLVTLVFMTAGIGGGSYENALPLFTGTGVVGVLGGIAAVFVTAPFWYVGFDTIPQGAEEADVHVPPRRLGRLIVVSIAGATAFYGLIITTVAVVTPWPEIADDALPTAQAFSAAFESRWMVNLVLLAALLGLLTAWNGFFIAGSRVLFALGRGRIVPEWLGFSHPRYGTPGNAILLTGAITVAGAVLGRGAMLPFVDVGSFCIAVAFLGVSYSTIKLRRTAPHLPRPYRIPGGTFVPRVALLGSLFIVGVMLVPGTAVALLWPLEWIILGGFLCLGGFFWIVGRDRREGTDEDSRKQLILGDEVVPGL